MDENTKHQVAAKLTGIFFAPLPLETRASGDVEHTVARSREDILEVYKSFLQDLDNLAPELASAESTGT
jgi:hypothetical protein